MRKDTSPAVPEALHAGIVRLLIALAALLLAVFLEYGHDRQTAADAWLRDTSIRLHAGNAPDPRIAIVDIDETSLLRLGPWPWPRERIADLVELLLAQQQVRGVALDMVLPEAGSANGDSRLATLAEQAPLVMSQALDYVDRSRPLRVGTLSGSAHGLADVPLATATGYVANTSRFQRARCTGNIGFVPDGDGVLRSVPLASRFDAQVYPALSMALPLCSGLQLKPPYGVNSDGLWRLPFTRHWSAYTVVSAADVLTGAIPDGLLAGRYLIVGSSALGLGDRVATPLSASTAGMLVHATALGGLLDTASGLAPAAWPGRLIACLFALLATVCALFGFPRLSAARSLLMLVLMAVLWLSVSHWIIPHDPMFSPSGPLLTLLILLGFAIPFEWGRVQKESKHLLNMFQHYVSPAVIDELLRARGRMDPLAPRHLEVTTLISDMEGYASLVEGAPLVEAVALTRGFLDCLTGPVLESGGTLDKYTGDGLMAFWGAPLPITDHAEKALEAAREIHRRVAHFNATRIAQGKPKVRVRIGIESGLAMVGDLGTPFRSAYTAVGDSVNLASRLQELARELPHDILVGSHAAKLSRSRQLLPLGKTHLRGRHQSEEIFALAEGGTENSGTQGFQPELAI